MQGPADEETALKILEELDWLENLQQPEPEPVPEPEPEPQPAPRPQPQPQPQPKPEPPPSNVEIKDLNRPYEESHDTDAYPMTLHMYDYIHPIN